MDDGFSNAPIGRQVQKERRTRDGFSSASNGRQIQKEGRTRYAAFPSEDGIDAFDSFDALKRNQRPSRLARGLRRSATPTIVSQECRRPQEFTTDDGDDGDNGSADGVVERMEVKHGPQRAAEQSLSSQLHTDSDTTQWLPKAPSHVIHIRMLRCLLLSMLAILACVIIMKAWPLLRTARASNPRPNATPLQWLPGPPPPSPRPPHTPPANPPPQDIFTRLNQLNSRFEAGKPSSDLSTAGVWLHTFDALDDGRDDVWNPCPNNAWCGMYNDRWSVSVVNARNPYFFRGSGKEPGNQPNGGFVLEPRALEPVHSSIPCAWAIDGGTLGVVCKGLSDECIPGCRNGFECGSVGYETDYCWWPPTKLKQMMEQQERLAPSRSVDTCNEDECRYNEVIVSSPGWARNLPWLIAAVYFPAHSRPGEVRARAVHRALLRAFPHLNSSSYGTPLLRYTGADMNASSASAFELVEAFVRKA